MGIISTAARLLIAAGVSGDALVTAIEQIEESESLQNSTRSLQNSTEREKKNLYQRRWREKRKDSVFPTEISTSVENVENYPIYTKKVSKKVSKYSVSRLTLECIPPEWKSYSLQKRPDLKPEDIFDDFRDWYLAAAGEKGERSDWFATWRTWVKNQRAPETNGHTQLIFKTEDRIEITDEQKKAASEWKKKMGIYSTMQAQ